MFLIENLVPTLVLVIEKLFQEIIAKELVEHPHVAYKVYGAVERAVVIAVEWAMIEQRIKLPFHRTEWSTF